MKQISIDVPSVYRTEDVDIDKIIADERDEAVYRDVFKSISAIKTVLQPVCLVEDGKNYRVIYGSRRVLAAKKAGMDKIESKIFKASTPPGVIAVFVLTENQVRKPNPAAETAALRMVLNEYGWTLKEASDNTGVPLSSLKSTARLFNLIPEIFEQLRAGKISKATALRLSKLPKDKQGEFIGKESITFDAAEKAVKENRAGEFIPAELFSLPETDEAKRGLADSMIVNAISALEKAIKVTTNGRRKKMERALKILKEVLPCPKA
jgi:ParB-like chromosome segregation protein Spo0J